MTEKIFCFLYFQSLDFLTRQYVSFALMLLPKCSSLVGASVPSVAASLPADLSGIAIESLGVPAGLVDDAAGTAPVCVVLGSPASCSEEIDATLAAIAKGLTSTFVVDAHRGEELHPDQSVKEGTSQPCSLTAVADGQITLSANFSSNLPKFGQTTGRRTPSPVVKVVSMSFKRFESFFLVF